MLPSPSAGRRGGVTGTVAEDEAPARLDAHRFDPAVMDTALPDLAGSDVAGRPAVIHRPPVLYLAGHPTRRRPRSPAAAAGSQEWRTRVVRSPRSR
ncbi:hypothetical protein ACFWBB_37680 [Streptomyces sp. NPDC060000]|uniref:hypothetical protein n=1 Tax=Streptomyces sp. NPDC060000 TaxID=3347031 RepID=UPI003684128B